MMYFVNTSFHHPVNKFTVSKPYKGSYSSNCFKNSCSEVLITLAASLLKNSPASTLKTTSPSCLLLTRTCDSGTDL